MATQKGNLFDIRSNQCGSARPTQFKKGKFYTSNIVEFMLNYNVTCNHVISVYLYNSLCTVLIALRDSNLLELSERVTNRQELMKLGVKVLKQPDKIKSALYDHRDSISAAAYEVLSEWRNGQPSRQKAHSTLISSLGQHGMLHLVGASSAVEITASPSMWSESKYNPKFNISKNVKTNMDGFKGITKLKVQCIEHSEIRNKLCSVNILTHVILIILHRTRVHSAVSEKHALQDFFFDD